MNLRRSLIGLIGLLAFTIFVSTTADAQSAEKLSLSELAIATGESTRKVDDSTVVISVKSPSKKLVEVMLGHVGNDLLFIVEIAKGDDYKLTLDLAESLLKFQSTLDWVRVEMNKKGDLQVFIHADARVVGQEAFNERLNQIVVATERVGKILEPHLTKKS